MVAHSAQPFPLYCRDFLYGAAISSTVSRFPICCRSEGKYSLVQCHSTGGATLATVKREA